MVIDPINDSVTGHKCPIWNMDMFPLDMSCRRRQSATFSVWGCLGQKEVVAAAHNGCIRDLLQEVNVHGKADRHMRLLD